MPLFVFRSAVLAALLVSFAVIPCQAKISPAPSSPGIVINLPSRTLDLFSGNELIKTYPVAIGKPSTPTPLGSFAIFEKEVDPWWYPPRTGEAVPSGPDNPLGYRWMGFAPLYGMHGTNAPWAIGQAVSNGCVRMHEEDAEELFEVVPYGTPVQITYERVKVSIDHTGQASIGIYPDIYGYQAVTVAQAKNRLAAKGLDGYLSDAEILRLIQEEADKQIVFAHLGNIRVNGKRLADWAVTVQNVLYIPVWPVAGALNASIAWDEQNQQVRGGKRSVPGTVMGERVFVTARDAQLLFGGQQVWQPEDNILEIDVLELFFNGKPLAADVQVVDGVLAIPLLPLAEAVGQKIIRSPDVSYWLHGSKVPTASIADAPYIQITKIYDVFQTYVYWNQQARSIELTYPFQVKGGND
ncbi:MAG: L,D-transpeptidase family protein [Negativicutes bacterium]|nr:L,D-transpeptidase family protein [Negativicutes bacterium]